MFSGIVQTTASIRETEKREKGRRVLITAPRGWRLKEGQSIAVDGICSTVVRARKDGFEVGYMPETLRVTTARNFAKGRVVNLERSLKFGDTVDGHFVQGHVEGVGEVARVALQGDARLVTFHVPRKLVRYIAPKGSITVNGVALTVARIQGSLCTVALMRYTLTHTNLGALKKGDCVNIETDLLARYLAKLRGK